MRRLLPRPAMSAAIFVVWLLLTNAASLATLLLGLLLAVLLPAFTVRFWPGAPSAGKPWVVAKLAWVFSVDIILANWGVARRVLGPVKRLSPCFVDVPLDLRDPFVITILGSMVSLTPGTVSIDADLERRILHVHALDAPDPALLIQDIKQRYEAPLKEIFSC